MSEHQHQASEDVAEVYAEPKVFHGDKLARLKYEANKRRMIEAYEEWVTSGNLRHDILLEFATIKLHHLEREFHKTGTYTTVDDYAQEVLIAVWENRSSFAGNSGIEFYNWVHRIAFVKAAQFFNVLLDKKRNYTTLTVTGKDEDGDEEEIDNPELFSRGYSDVGIRIPPSVTGLDRLIFSLMLTERYDPDRPNYVTPGSRVLNPDNPKGGYRGMNYAEIAATLRITPNQLGEDWSKMTPGAVEVRVRRVRNRLKKEREEREQARLGRPTIPKAAEETIEKKPKRAWKKRAA